jgi:hypothetical protein
MRCSLMDIRAAPLAALLLLAALLVAPSANAGFGIVPGSYSVTTSTSQAGGHPDLTVAFKLNLAGTAPDQFPDENVKSIETLLPAGFVGNPQAVARCSADFLSAQGFCPAETQVGVLTYTLGGIPFNPTVSGLTVPVYNMVPGGSHPAELAFFNRAIARVKVPILTAVSPSGGYRVATTVPQIASNLKLFESSLTLWGVPADPSHDGERGLALAGGCLTDQGPTGSLCPSGLQPKAFLSNPTQCGSSGTLDLTAESWQHPGAFIPTLFSAPLTMTGCEALRFEPSLSAQPETRKAAVPAGYTVTLHVPQSEPPTDVATPHVKKAVVTLPEGVRISPSAAGGLQGCSDAQIGLHTDADVTCPDASKIGSVVVRTPLLPDPLEGAVYQGTQTSTELVRIFIVVKGPGVIVKLPGSVSLDESTGRIETTFDDNPQLPFEDFILKFKGGPRAPLANPRTCGPKTTTAALTSWSGQTVTTSDTFTVSGDGLGAACPSARFAPSVSAGLTSPVAGSSSSFVMRVQRDDADSELQTISTKLPPGLLAKVAGVPLCRDVEATAGNCPVASQIGRAQVGAGPGANPFYITDGKMFLTTGYKGAPFGLSIVVPAVAGPLNLGNVVVRAALRIDPETAQATVEADPMPRILGGIPLQVRDVRVMVDRPRFMRAPTSCKEMSVTTKIGSYDGDIAQVPNRFQVGDCAALAYNPKLRLRLTGPKQMRTGGHPGVKAQVTQKGIEDAGIKRTVVRLPKALALDPDNANALCEFEDGIRDDIEKHCPKGSIVGRARAVTPLLDRPLAGNVYFVKNVYFDKKTGNRIRTLPMLVVALRGEIAINLRGKSSSTNGGQLVNTFKSVPDAPIKRFDLNIHGGGNGILTVTRTAKSRINLCAKPDSHVADVEMAGHNGKRRAFGVRIKTPCAKKGQKAGAKRKPAKRR